MAWTIKNVIATNSKIHILAHLSPRLAASVLNYTTARAACIVQTNVKWTSAAHEAFGQKPKVALLLRRCFGFSHLSVLRGVDFRNVHAVKAITVSQPYASLIASGEKWVENRNWSTNYQGPLAIHAGKGTHYLTRSEVATSPQGVLAVCRLSACVALEDFGIESSPHKIPGTNVTIADFLNHRHTEGPWCWILEDIRKVGPFPCKGSPGLWSIHNLEFD